MICSRLNVGCERKKSVDGLSNQEHCTRVRLEVRAVGSLALCGLSLWCLSLPSGDVRRRLDTEV